MEGNNNNGKWWLWFVIPIAALTTWKIFRNTARGANRVTDDMTTNEAQAVMFYGLLGVKNVLGTYVSTPTFLPDTLRKIGWLARNVNDWDKVQRAFTNLCGGTYTFFQAASNALAVNEYDAVVDLINTALTQRRIFCGDIIANTLYNANRYGGQAGESFQPNTFVGRCTGEDSDYYYYVSWRDGVTYQAPKDLFILK